MDAPHLAPGGNYGRPMGAEDETRTRSSSLLNPVAATAWVLAAIPNYIWGLALITFFLLGMLLYDIDIRILAAAMGAGVVWMGFISTIQNRRKRNGNAVSTLRAAYATYDSTKNYKPF